MVGPALGRTFADGEVIIRQGEEGDSMFVIQAGTVEVVQSRDGREVRLTELAEGDFFGEMALFAREVRSATVRAKGETSVLTVDRRTLLSRIQKDPTLAFRILERMSNRLGDLDHKYARVTASDRRNWDTRPDEPPGRPPQATRPLGRGL